MKLAIMQPYFFPYIGYWQLINVVDKFIIYDDVNYIKRGWINRNRILINGSAAYLTMPLDHPSQNKKICDTELNTTLPWRNKLLRTIELSYRKAPHFNDVYPIIDKLIRYEVTSLSSFLSFQLQSLSVYMGIDVVFKTASSCYEDAKLEGEKRILDICKKEGATTYVNPQGGKKLYSRKTFKKNGIEIRFLSPLGVEYKQFGDIHVPWLSIIDVLMFNSKNKVRLLLNECELI